MCVCVFMFFFYGQLNISAAAPHFMPVMTVGETLLGVKTTQTHWLSNMQLSHGTKHRDGESLRPRISNSLAVRTIKFISLFCSTRGGPGSSKWRETQLVPAPVWFQDLTCMWKFFLFRWEGRLFLHLCFSFFHAEKNTKWCILFVKAAELKGYPL